MPKNIVFGNWKMHKTSKEVRNFFEELLTEDLSKNCLVGVAPQLIHLNHALAAAKDKVLIGAQNASAEEFGAFTGETSADSLADMQVSFSLVGHSERRSYFGETDEFINRKIKKLLQAKMIPVLCIGESLEQRKEGRVSDVVIGQLMSSLRGVDLVAPDQLIIAYEPVWAIGTGETATPLQAQEVHAMIRAKLEELYPAHGSEISILYGGSVKPGNFSELLTQKDINGGLVGGASLKAADFRQLVQIAGQ